VESSTASEVATGFETGLALTPEERALDRARGRTERHPFLSSDKVRATLPFGLVLIGAFAVVPLEGGDDLDLLALGLAGIVIGMLVAAAFLGPWQQLPAWVRMLPPLAFLLVVALLREAAGAGDSGFAALVLIVPVWAALYEGEKSLIVAVIGVALTLILPILLIGEPDYDPAEQFRQAEILIAISIFLGFAVQHLVQDAHDRTSEARRSRRFVLAAMSSAVEGVVALDGDGKVVFSNPSAQRMLGFESDEMIGAVFHHVAQHTTADGESNPRGGSPLEQTLRTGIANEVRGEVFWRKDGSSFPVVYRCAAFTDTEGGQDGAVLSFVDVAEQRRVEQLKDELLSVVGHELRTPLTSIRGSLGLIDGGAAGEITPEVERMIAIAISNTDRLSRLINDILDIERIESGRVQLSRQLCEVPDLIAQSLETLANQAGAADVELVGEPVEATLWADPDRILQALMNLISNAIKFSPPGSKVIVAAAREGNEVRFSVADRGRGIPANQLDAVFERFRQVDASDSREKGGTGLGLPISRSIVHQHGGRIWAESEVGEGTTFSFTIPALAAPSANGADVHEGPLALVIEDDGDLADVLEVLLEQGGLGVWKAGDATEAVRLLGRRAPELIVLDLKLPDADGSELVRWMRKQPGLAGVPLAVYTDADITDELREALRLGPTIHFTKSRLKPAEFAHWALDLVVGGSGEPAGAPGGSES